jgi:hypothetical protein
MTVSAETTAAPPRRIRVARRRALAEVLREHGRAAFWIVPALLALELAAMGGFLFGPRGGPFGGICLVLAILPLALVGLLVVASGVLLLTALVAKPWRWAVEKTLDWRAEALR